MVANTSLMLFLFVAAMGAGGSPTVTVTGPSTEDAAAMRFLKETYELSKDKNVVTSPIGVFMLLSLYSAGAEGVVREEIIKALGFKDFEKFTNNYSRLSKKYLGMNNDYFSLANKVYLDKHHKLIESFHEVALKSYDTEVESIDFKNVKEVTETINKWADEKTKGHIKSPVEETDLSADAVAMLINIIFFEGHWHVPFNVNGTEYKDFHVDSTTTVKKPTMVLEEIPLFHHDSQELNVKMVELPYQEQGFRMVIVLPNEIDGLPSVLDKIAQRGIRYEIANLKPSIINIKLQMPRFEVRNKLDLNTILPKINISKIFTEAATGILNSPVVLDKALQEAYINVDEKGARAGAYTGSTLSLLCSECGPPPPIEFNIDHPFLFMILYEDVILFAGTYTR